MGVRSEVGNIPAFDGMRGVAVLWVIGFHYVALREAAADPWVEALRALPALDSIVRNGYLGVDLFFLISGFLLMLPWYLHARSGQPAPAAGPFYARRFRRIAPAYYVQLAALFLVVIPLLRGADYWKRDLYVIAWNVAAHGGFVHNTSPLTSGSMGINGALWTLAVEAQYYLLLPLLAPLLVRAPLRSAAIAFAVAIAWQHAARHGLEPIVAAYQRAGAHWAWPENVIRVLLVTQLPSYLGHFALGSLLGRAWLLARERPPSPRERLSVALAGWMGALVVFALLASRIPVWGEQTWLLTTAALGALLYAAARGDGALARVLLARGPLAFVGRISYSAYLWHLPVLLLLLHAAPGPSALLLPAYLLAVVALSWLSWRLIERRFIRGV
ncbi:MAG TPA: acyltransferase [Usitatibacter sp.]|nr:acyltransferase [Usitatibacter sp.]